MIFKTSHRPFTAVGDIPPPQSQRYFSLNKKTTPSWKVSFTSDLTEKVKIPRRWRYLRRPILSTKMPPLVQVKKVEGIQSSQFAFYIPVILLLCLVMFVGIVRILVRKFYLQTKHILNKIFKKNRSCTA
jgi:hypothetical protein